MGELHFTHFSNTHLYPHTARLQLRLPLPDLPAPPCCLQRNCCQPVLLQQLLQTPPQQPCPH
jgi:hypothetical protein